MQINMPFITIVLLLVLMSTGTSGKFDVHRKISQRSWTPTPTANNPYKHAHTPYRRDPDNFSHKRIDVYMCTRVKELESKIQTLTADIHNHVSRLQSLRANIETHISDASLRSRLLTIALDGHSINMAKSTSTNTTTKNTNTTTTTNTTTNTNTNKHRNTKTQTSSSNTATSSPASENNTASIQTIREKREINSACVAYPSYVDSGQCTICGGGNPLNAWSDTCEGRCLQQIVSNCYACEHVDSCFETPLHCEQTAVCIDCSSIVAPTETLDRVPCPPLGYSGDNTSRVLLLLDNNHQLNLTNAFGAGNPYFKYLVGLSLTNTTLTGSQFNYREMLILGNINMSATTIVGGITDRVFFNVVVGGVFDLSFANIVGEISTQAFSTCIIQVLFDLNYATITGGINAYAFQGANLGIVDMNSAIIHMGISNYAFSDARIKGSFYMGSATVYAGITTSAFSLCIVRGDFVMSHTTIVGGLNSAAFGGMTVLGDFDMTAVNITEGLINATFSSATIFGNLNMESATVTQGISEATFYNTIINGDVILTSASVTKGITNFAFSGASVAGNLLLVDTVFVEMGIEPGVFLGVSVGEVFNASGAVFPNNTLPVQMLYGLEVQKGVDFSHCNLQTLQNNSCSNGGCYSYINDQYQLDRALHTYVDFDPAGLEGGPFTGMAMPVGIVSTVINLSHNNLVAITNTSLLGITATVLDLSDNDIEVFHPFWFLSVPNAKSINTANNPSVCVRVEYDANNEEAYTYQESGTINCTCALGTYGTGNFCARQSCSDTLSALNAYSRKYLGNGSYRATTMTMPTTSPYKNSNNNNINNNNNNINIIINNNNNSDNVAAGDTVTLQCPQGTHPNNALALSVQCLGGAFEPQTNQCVRDDIKSWFTPGRIVGIVFSVLIVAAIVGYVVLLSPEKRKGKRLANALGITVNEVELNERLLHETNCDLEEATVLNTRMRGAWKIEEDDVNIGAVMASGAFGVVHDATFAGLRVAVKVLKQPLDEENYPDVGKDFTRECETLMAIRHACLLIFYGAGLTSENRPFMVTEFMSRGSLKRVLADPTQELLWPMRFKFALQIAKAMQYLHAVGIIHRDLKSDNCLVNDLLNLKVCDFGTSKFLTTTRPTLETLEQSTTDVDVIGGVSVNTKASTNANTNANANANTNANTNATANANANANINDSLALATTTMTKGVGTASWMAPELFVGGTKYKQEVDLYSYGMILWELATREIPWTEIKETEYIRFFAALDSALKNDRRPTIPEEVQQSQADFVALMKLCWATNPLTRPTFDYVVETLS